MPTETELKLAIDPAAVAGLLRHPALRSVRNGRMRTAQLVAHYYDTADARLARDNVALRVRYDGRRWIQALKGPAEAAAGAGLQVRGEWEWPLPDAKLDPALLAATPWRKLIAKAARRGGFVRSFTTEFERRTLPLAFADGTRAELAIDRGEIRAVCDRRLRRERISEIEIELGAGDAANLFRLALAFQADVPLTVMTDSKAARGHALRRGHRLAVQTPVHATRVALAADATAEDALGLVARECLQQIAANAPGLLTDDDPEWIHQMRVGTRRLRSCLSLVARIERTAPLDDVRAEVKWLAERLGRARDWDVLATQTLPPLAASFGRGDALAPGVARVRARVAARRRSARTEARAAVASPRFNRLLLAAGLLCATVAFGAKRADDVASETPGPATRRADAFAAELLTRRHRKLCERGAMLSRASEQERHAVRIAAKRLRYAADFFAPLFARRRSRAYLETLSELQDVLGHFNDAATASALAPELAGAKDEAAAAVIRGWVAAQSAALAPRLAKEWARFQACEPFWY